MDIYAKKGIKVKFKESHPFHTQWGNHDEANDYLKKDQEYTVLRTDPRSSWTYVYLEEFPDKRFSSGVFY